MEVIYNSNLKLIITGYKGYIGQSIIEGTQDNNWNICLLEEACLAKSLIHLAAKVNCKNNIDMLTNINTDIAIVEFAIKNNIKIIYASGNNTYPFKASCNINDNITWSDNYSFSKYIGELLISQSLDNYTLVRIGDVFGVNQRQGNFFRAVENAIKQTNGNAKIYGSGGKIRSYIYIKELVNILLFLAKNPSSTSLPVINVCHQEPISIKMILDYLKTKQAFSHIEQIDSPFETRSYFDYRTMIQTTIPGYIYQYNIFEALDDYIKECRNEKL